MVKAITYILENNAGVQALVGTRVGGTSTDYKVYPVVVPETEKAPYIAVRLSSKEQVAKNCGYNYTIQVVCYDLTYDAVTALNEAVIVAIEATAAGTVNGVDFGYSNFSNESDEFDKDHNLYAKVSTFQGMAD